MCITLPLLLGLNACQNEEEYFYSSKKELGAKLFHLSADDIKQVSCRLHDESLNSRVSPPVLDPTYKFVGIIELNGGYQVANASESQQKNIQVLYPASISAQDWRTSPQWNQELMQDGISGEIYYSPSLHAFYVELMYQKSNTSFST